MYRYRGYRRFTVVEKYQDLVIIETNAAKLRYLRALGYL